MSKIIKILAVLILIPAMLLGAANVCLAGPIPAGFDIWDTRTTDDVNKSWTIKFNRPPAAGTINSSSICITDSDNRPLSATLSISGDGASVTVRPTSPYTVGNEYRLYVTNEVCARSADGQKGAPLSKPLVLPFIITAQGSYIQSVSSMYHTLLTTITVTTSKAVHSVSINGVDMQYLGDNKFRVAVPGLAPGAIVIIETYDGSGNLLVVHDYTVK